MPITRSQIDSVFLRGYRLAELLPLVNMDGTTVDGTNADVGDFLSQAFGSMGKVPSAFGQLSNADLSNNNITDPQARQMIAIGQLQALRTISTHYRFYDQRNSMEAKNFNQIRDGINVAIKDLEALLRNLYGYGLASLNSGTIGLGYDAPSGCEFGNF